MAALERGGAFVTGARENDTPLAFRMERLKKSIEYIKLHHAENVSLADLADRAGMSLYHFARSFKARVGCTPMDYLARFRIDVASNLLSDSDRKVSDIAASVGYGSTSQFIKVFRKNMGDTPEAWRKDGGREGGRRP